MRILVIAMGTGFVVNLVVGWVAFRSVGMAVGFALLGMLMGGALGAVEVWLRRRQQRGRR
ncbi:MAG: hypothetical protein NZ951_05865 [Dehalococcoidia bacterium]|nr:hypothetical protein [Dehalococcoidia bacterium]MDW8119916.1 hypothetical protein [Chloroflexota bacterium]